jgi:hypothetical protein
MAHRTVHTLTMTGITIVSAAVLIASGATGASAATDFTRYGNAEFGECLSEDGTTSVVGLSPCNANDSEHWGVGATAAGYPGFYQLVNQHSGQCLSVNGDIDVVGTSPCNSNHAEFWSYETNSNPTIIYNLHTGFGLQAVDDGANGVVQSAEPINPYDLWCEGNLSALPPCQI